MKLHEPRVIVCPKTNEPILEFQRSERRPHLEKRGKNEVTKKTKPKKRTFFKLSPVF